MIKICTCLWERQKIERGEGTLLRRLEGHDPQNLLTYVNNRRRGKGRCVDKKLKLLRSI